MSSRHWSDRKKSQRETTVNNTVVCSCYISPLKRIIFEVVRPERETERESGEFVAVICLKTLPSIELECVLMLFKRNETTKQRYFCINLQLALFISLLASVVHSSEIERFGNLIFLFLYRVCMMKMIST